MTPHIEAQKGDYAEIVLLPGDPLRAQWIAENFFESPRQVNGVRNCLGFTGKWQGTPVSVQATGMGQPSTAIYVHELLNVYEAKTLVRVGTCGGLTTKVKVRDIILGSAASTDSAKNTPVFAPYTFAPAADFELLKAADDYAIAQMLEYHVGGLVSSDTFYLEDPANSYATLARHGVLAVEMEASTLYTLAARYGARALAICTVSDCLVTGEEMEPEDRQSTLDTMVEMALTVATQ
ncbi:purine-nucleoside phosphorylase [Nitratireductor sp. XY-223]|uniref:purine-nucleoside phosphorylase n=1 Tax=Nitratireductor sp. XY-223 TaxID=2561926 RepID=UPI0010A99FA5|nr:purine-nucleoside phosphorylase [Nitratireductor sp. XY-223]